MTCLYSCVRANKVTVNNLTPKDFIAEFKIALLLDSDYSTYYTGQILIPQRFTKAFSVHNVLASGLPVLDSSGLEVAVLEGITKNSLRASVGRILLEAGFLMSADIATRCIILKGCSSAPNTQDFQDNFSLEADDFTKVELLSSGK